MEVKYGDSESIYGPGVNVILDGEEVAIAISAYLTAHNIHIAGACTITVNGSLCKKGNVYVDPSGFVIYKGKKFSTEED